MATRIFRCRTCHSVSSVAPASETPRVGVAIGDDILDIPACVAAELFKAFGDDVQHAARACVSLR